MRTIGILKTVCFDDEDYDAAAKFLLTQRTPPNENIRGNQISQIKSYLVETTPTKHMNIVITATHNKLVR